MERFKYKNFVSSYYFLMMALVALVALSVVLLVMGWCDGVYGSDGGVNDHVT